MTIYTTFCYLSEFHKFKPISRYCLSQSADTVSITVVNILICVIEMHFLCEERNCSHGLRYYASNVIWKILTGKTDSYEF